MTEETKTEPTEDVAARKAARAEKSRAAFAVARAKKEEKRLAELAIKEEAAQHDQDVKVVELRDPARRDEKVDRKALVSDLNLGVVAIMINVNGQIREVRATLMRGQFRTEDRPLLVNHIVEQQTRTDGLMTVWDVWNKNWATFHLGDVISCQAVTNF
jgi:hypothetical protein